MTVLDYRPFGYQRYYKSRSMVGSLVCAGFLLMLPSQGVARLNDAPAISPAPAAGSLPADGLFFADAVVRGKVVFQVGSLSNLSASDRAAIINRRIASLVSQSTVNRSIAWSLPIPNGGS